MESKAGVRFTLGKQSSLAPDLLSGLLPDGKVDAEHELEGIDEGVRLMYLCKERDLEGINELLGGGVDVNFRDIDNRSALHVASCQGYSDVVQLLLDRGADVDPKDRWGSTPLADAIHYKNNQVIRLLEKHGAMNLEAPMRVKNAREVPEYEINPEELDFTNSVNITKGTFRIASWRGIKVAVKELGNGHDDDEKVTSFRDELALLQKIRHPNVVQFLGAVTQSSPMMIVTEYLPKGDLCAFLEKRGALKPVRAVRFGLDIARQRRGVLSQQGNELSSREQARTHHSPRPGALVLSLSLSHHHPLSNENENINSNILRDDSGHLKVADFDISKLSTTTTVRGEHPLRWQDSSCRYIAPEVFRNEEYDTKVDVFSFALILQEMIEGFPPFLTTEIKDVPKVYAAKQRPAFRAPVKFYAYGLKDLIVECWSENPSDRPTFREIIKRLEIIYTKLANNKRWKLRTLKCLHSFEAMWRTGGRSASGRSRSSRSRNA